MGEGNERGQWVDAIFSYREPRRMKYQILSSRWQLCPSPMLQ
jgi:hypothetical protein